ncbi:MAG: DUF6140 family protein [Bacteroidaceae bacterium]|nr:DUF6140 family protein [Bacteroidaceae bacterium]
MIIIPLFRIIVKSRVHTNGGQIVADAFMRIYGVDIKKAGA